MQEIWSICGGTLDHFRGLEEGEDTLRWIHHSKGVFTVSSAYKNLNQMGTQLRFLPWKLIWKVKIPYKVVVKEAVLTQENLMKRGIHVCPRYFFFVSNRQRQSTICFFIARWLDKCGTYLPDSGAQTGPCHKGQVRL